jgi:hypothetical protein
MWLWSKWKEVLVIVRPETVVGWHRAGFRLNWNWLSRHRKVLGRKQVLGFFEFFRERERGDFCFQRLAEAFIGADSRNLKTRRLPASCLRPHFQ